MKELNESKLNAIAGGGDLPANSPVIAPSEAYIAAIMALLAGPRVVHHSD